MQASEVCQQNIGKVNYVSHAGDVKITRENPNCSS